MKINFVKRDGSVEDYNEEKIARVLIATGLSKEDAQKLARAVTISVEEAKELKINSLQVRNKIIEELKKINKNAASLFQWYEKNKK